MTIMEKRIKRLEDDSRSSKNEPPVIIRWLEESGAKDGWATAYLRGFGRQEKLSREQGETLSEFTARVELEANLLEAVEQ